MMRNMPHGVDESSCVSIVVPVYNVEQFLPQCLASLTKQTLESKEILLINDGSTDNSGDIAERWSREYPFIKVFHKENGGCASARSFGLSQATGQYVGFVDSDDWVEPLMFEKLYRLALRYQADIAQCGFRRVSEQQKTVTVVEEHYDLSHRSEHGGRLKDPKLLLLYIPSIWRKIYKRSFLLHNGIDFCSDFRMYDDIKFHFDTCTRARCVSVMEKAYYNYRVDRIGQDIAVKDERLWVLLAIFAMISQELQHMGSGADGLQGIFLKIQLDTHAWALNKIDRRLWLKYFFHAAHAIYIRHPGWSRFRRLKYVWKHHSKRRKLATAMFMSAFAASILRLGGPESMNT